MWSVSINRHQPERPFRFGDLLSLQGEVLAKIRPSGGSALLFAELPSTLTLGARQILSNSPRVEALRLRRVEVVSGERGGNETWHGPGQWVGFVLTPLLAFTGDSKGVRRAVHLILESVLPVAKRFIPEARIEEGSRLGIWSDRGKLCSVGIKIRDGYTSSGFALNCIPNPEAFAGIDPCGIRGALPDFIFRDLGDGTQRSREFENVPSWLHSSFEKSRA
jgi:lipoyl(octanoyl) transferase